MRTVMGEAPPPLRWTRPAGAPRRKELAALYPSGPVPRLAGVTRAAPPFRRPGGWLVGSDARPLVIQALLAHAAVWHGVQPEPEEVRRVLAWIVDRSRPWPR